MCFIDWPLKACWTLNPPRLHRYLDSWYPQLPLIMTLDFVLFILLHSTLLYTHSCTAHYTLSPALHTVFTTMLQSVLHELPTALCTSQADRWAHRPCMSPVIRYCWRVKTDMGDTIQNMTRDRADMGGTSNNITRERTGMGDKDLQKNPKILLQEIIFTDS